MISYAQNFEDVMLRRALPDIVRGFYIDIGAFHPVVDNVTQWFYSQGWTGINVEPNPEFQDLLRDQRPHDLNLPVAVSGQTGTLHLHLLDGLSTTVRDVAHQHAAGGRVAREVVAVDALSLADLFERHLGERTVDFLKIDVEGAEASILRAYPFVRVRPRVLVIEATEPDSIASASLDWEPDLLTKGYRFCYFDGLNRFYVRDEDSWRLSLFAVPPNVFDNFLLPYTDRRIDYVSVTRYVSNQAPEQGIQPLLSERDGLRRERDSLIAQIAVLSSERDTRVRQGAQLLAEREAFAVHVADLAQAQTAVRANFAAQVAELSRANAAERGAFAVQAADLVQATAAERDAFAVQVADLARGNAAQRDAFAVQVADLAQAHRAERDAFAAQVADLARGNAAQRDAFAVQVADLAQAHRAEREAIEGQITKLHAVVAERQAAIQTLEHTLHRLAAEGTRLKAAYDGNLVNAARLQIKVNAARNNPA